MPDKRDNAPRGRVPARPPAYNKQIPQSVDMAIWTDDCNFDHNIASQVPNDGMESTQWDAVLKHGIRRT